LSESKEDIGNSIKKSSLAALLTVVFLDNLGFAILLPYLYYYVTFLGGSVFDYGLLLATYSLMSFIFTPLISRLSDRYGRRRILLSAVMISSISYFVVGIGQFLWILFLGRMLAGTTAATYPISQAYMVDVTSKESRLRYIGYLGASAGIAFIIGPLIGGTLSSIAGFNIPAFLAATLATTNLILTFLFLPEPTVSHSDLSARAVTIKALRKVLQKRSIQMLLGTYFLFFLAFMFLQTTLTPWLEGIFGFSEFETCWINGCICSSCAIATIIYKIEQNGADNLWLVDAIWRFFDYRSFWEFILIFSNCWLNCSWIRTNACHYSYVNFIKYAT